jgi:hypothetical protein
MGMFDYLFIDKNMLPISDEEKIIIGVKLIIGLQLNSL